MFWARRGGAVLSPTFGFIKHRRASRQTKSCIYDWTTQGQWITRWEKPGFSNGWPSSNDKQGKWQGWVSVSIRGLSVCCDELCPRRCRTTKPGADPYRWVPLYSKMLNPNFHLIQKSLAKLILYPCNAILLNSKFSKLERILLGVSFLDQAVGTWTWVGRAIF